MKALHKYGFLILLTITLADCASHKKTMYNILNDLKQNNNNEKFDIDLFNNNRNDNSYIYTSENGSVIEIVGDKNIGVNELQYPVNKLYTIQKIFYPNLNIKYKGFNLKGVKIGKGDYYDEYGNITVKNEDEKFGKFDYNQLILFLDKKGYVDIQKGNWKNVVDIEFDNDNDKKLWKVYINDGIPRQLVIDGNSGKIIRTNRIYVYE
ncbi:MAG: hypothetical protein FWF53_09345 [Candidatus Azobacteroides sp.]|nr:hypothetical protein [Candidatus Azobacteroides sp.]